MIEEYPVYAKLSPQKLLQLEGNFGWEDSDDYDNEDVFLVEEREEFDCGFIPGQGCSMVATEECDFDCPYREELMKHPAYPNCDLLASDYSM